MDMIIIGELHKEAQDVDWDLSRLQNFTLDAADPLVFALEELATNDSPVATLLTSAVQ